ncbi:MAG: Alpha/beta hydrolase family protein [Promethearchaeota archaeon]|nr:MAG: Alpha/beta hydrolase family protein [Candidatus Lokiarchaeota archaeon]
MESSGHGFKGNLFRERIPGILTPDFREYAPDISYHDLLHDRMEEMIEILSKENIWKIIGSSFGGLMASLYTLQNPQKVKKLILLAPLLSVPELTPAKYDKISIPVIIFHGKNDKIIPIKKTKKRAQLLFKNLTYNLVDDDHMLHPTTESINWSEILK